jgi:hypothetical protein
MAGRGYRLFFRGSTTQEEEQKANADQKWHI